MRSVFGACLFAITCSYASSLKAAPDAPSPSSSPQACDASCAPPLLVQPIEYSSQVARGAEFHADVTIRQPCSCTRPLVLSLVFTALGAKTSSEHRIKLERAQGSSSEHVVLRASDLAKAKIAPGQYTIGFALRDDHDAPAGEPVSGLPFKLGTSQEALTTKPVLPPAIGTDSELAARFVFSNRGDIPVRVTALLAFTRPDTERAIEYYTSQLIVAPGGSQHVVRLSAAKRRTLEIGSGPWLVTSAAFDAEDKRLASFPGHLLLIGKTLSQPAPAQLSTPIEPTQDLRLTLTFKNTADIEDLVTAVLLFTEVGSSRTIEYKVEALHLPKGSSSHAIVLTAQDRYNLGIKPGHWRVTTTALDRAGKRLELQRAADVVIKAATAETAAR